MDPWIPSLITATSTILAGWGGLAWSGRKEKLHRQEDQAKADALVQRQAVADFLISMQKLRQEWEIELDYLTRLSPSEDQKKYAESLDVDLKNRRYVVSEILNAIDVLYLQLFNPALVSVLRDIEDRVKTSQEKYFKANIDQLFRMDSSDPSSKKDFMKANFFLQKALNPFSGEFKRDLTNLREAARINPQPSNKSIPIQGMFTLKTPKSTHD